MTAIVELLNSDDSNGFTFTVTKLSTANKVCYVVPDKGALRKVLDGEYIEIVEGESPDISSLFEGVSPEELQNVKAENFIEKMYTMSEYTLNAIGAYKVKFDINKFCANSRYTNSIIFSQERIMHITAAIKISRHLLEAVSSRSLSLFDLYTTASFITPSSILSMIHNYDAVTALGLNIPVTNFKKFIFDETFKYVKNTNLLNSDINFYKQLCQETSTDSTNFQTFAQADALSSTTTSWIDFLNDANNGNLASAVTGKTFAQIAKFMLSQLSEDDVSSENILSGFLSQDVFPLGVLLLHENTSPIPMGLVYQIFKGLSTVDNTDIDLPVVTEYLKAVISIALTRAGGHQILGDQDTVSISASSSTSSLENTMHNGETIRMLTLLTCVANHLNGKPIRPLRSIESLPVQSVLCPATDLPDNLFTPELSSLFNHWTSVITESSDSVRRFREYLLSKIRHYDATHFALYVKAMKNIYVNSPDFAYYNIGELLYSYNFTWDNLTKLSKLVYENELAMNILSICTSYSNVHQFIGFIEPLVSFLSKGFNTSVSEKINVAGIFLAYPGIFNVMLHAAAEVKEGEFNVEFSHETITKSALGLAYRDCIVNADNITPLVNGSYDA